MGIRCFFGFHPFKSNNQHVVRIAVLSNISLGKDVLELSFSNMAFVGNYHFCIDCGKVTALSVNYGTVETVKVVSFRLKSIKEIGKVDDARALIGHLVDRATANVERRKTSFDYMLHLTALDENLNTKLGEDQSRLTSHKGALSVYLAKPDREGVAPYLPVRDENIDELQVVIDEHNKLKGILSLLVEQYLKTESQLAKEA